MSKPALDAFAAAQAEAETSGEPVEVTSETSPTERLTANPDGTMTRESSTVPERVRRGGGWVPIDRTLVRAADGTLAPRATPWPTTFSGGGSGPFVRFGAGPAELALTWPKPLPEPVVDGPTATYPEVLAGVDLTVTAKEDSFAQALVVKTAEAARQPQLATLTFGLSVTGGTVHEEDGGFAVRNAIGRELISSPVPLMWDSTVVADVADGRSGSTSLRSARTASAASPPVVVAEPGAEAGVEGPGEASQVAPMDLSVTPTSLTLVPDRELLTGADTRFPLFIDPNPAAKPNVRNMVDKRFPDQEYYNWGGDDQGVGYQDYEPWSTKRLFYRFPTSRFAKKEIIKAEFAVTETWTGACTPQPVDVHQTHVTGAGTNWRNQPDDIEFQGRLTVADGNPKCEKGKDRGPDDHLLEFDVTSAVKRQAHYKKSSVTLRLKAQHEDDGAEWKRFDRQALLRVTYNSRPSAPRIESGPGGACETDPAEAPKAPAGIATVRAKVSDPDGDKLAGYAVFTDPSEDVITVPKGARKPGTFAFDTPARLTENGRWKYEVRTKDARTSSPTAGPCWFVLDSLAPPAPVIMLDGKEQEYEVGEDGDRGDAVPPVMEVGQEKPFTFGPGGGSKGKETVSYRWSVNRDVPGVAQLTTPPGGTATKTLGVFGVGPSVVRAWAYDAAGNRSAPSEFIVTGRGFTPSRWGLDGGTASLAADPACVPSGVGAAPSAISVHSGAAHVAGRSGLAVDTALAFAGAGNATTAATGPVVNGTTPQNYTVMGWVRVDPGVLDETDGEAASTLTSGRPQVALSVDGPTEFAVRVGVLNAPDTDPDTGVETPQAARFFASVIGANAKTGDRAWRTVVNQQTDVTSTSWYQVTVSVSPGLRLIELTVTEDDGFDVTDSQVSAVGWTETFDATEPTGSIRLGAARPRAGTTALIEPWRGSVDEVYALRGGQYSADGDAPGAELSYWIMQAPPFLRGGQDVGSPCAR